MVKRIKRTFLLNKKKELIGIRVEKSEGEIFDIPIADVRRDRRQVESIVKYANIHKGSKFFKPSYSVLGYKY